MALTKVRGAGVDFDGQDVILDADGDTKIAAGTDDVITVSTAGTERVRVLSGGGLDLSAGNLVLDNGYGIDFSATANSSGSVTHEILDDYEIGTFTPSFSGGISASSYNFQEGNYTKIGRLVQFNLRMDAASATTSSAHVKINNLPFTSASSGHVGSVTFGYNNNFDQDITGIVGNNSTHIELYNTGDGSTVTGSEVNATSDIYLTGTYITA